MLVANMIFFIFFHFLPLLLPPSGLATEEKALCHCAQIFGKGRRNPGSFTLSEGIQSAAKGYRVENDGGREKARGLIILED